LPRRSFSEGGISLFCRGARRGERLFENSSFDTNAAITFSLTIDYLGNHRDFIPQLAKWAYSEWRRVFDTRGMSLNDVVASFETRTNTDKLPLAIVAIENGEVIGTGCLKPGDLEIRPELSPWLGGIFVVPQCRNRGVATAIIHRLLQEALRLQLSVLYLWTPSAESLYARLGWKTIERLDYCEDTVSIMELAL
jgi:GNAT superfamily N-acetyltransferase